MASCTREIRGAERAKIERSKMASGKGRGVVCLKVYLLPEVRQNDRRLEVASLVLLWRSLVLLAGTT